MGDGETLELRPMNCPSHIRIHKHHIRSYRDLPLRVAEPGMMHGYEKSGALSGLQRVREMTLNDGHTFVELDQVQSEFAKILKLIMDVYRDFDITDYYFRLSYRDPKNTDKYFANDEMWERSQKMLKGAMDDLGLDYVEAERVKQHSMVLSLIFKLRLLWVTTKLCQLSNLISVSPRKIWLNLRW